MEPRHQSVNGRGRHYAAVLGRTSALAGGFAGMGHGWAAGLSAGGAGRAAAPEQRQAKLGLLAGRHREEKEFPFYFMHKLNFQFNFKSSFETR